MALPYVTAYLVARPEEAFPIEHPYVAEFSTPILGPTCVALLRWTAGHLTTGKTVPVDLAELAVRLGLQPHLGRNAPLMRTLRRLCLYNVAAWNPEPGPDTDGHLLIVDHLPPGLHPTGRTLARRPDRGTPNCPGPPPATRPVSLTVNAIDQPAGRAPPPRRGPPRVGFIHGPRAGAGVGRTAARGSSPSAGGSCFASLRPAPTTETETATAAATAPTHRRCARSCALWSHAHRRPLHHAP